MLQYWFFYVFNDWDNNHEGDWEMVQIILGNDKQPLLITYSMHHGGLTLPWDDPKVSKNGEHPLVYVTLGGHGSWNKPGDHVWYQKVCLRCTDETSEGNVLAPKDASVPSDYKYTLEDLSDSKNNWIQWKGYWGKQVWTKRDNLWDVGSSGPSGPPYVDYIEGDGVGNGRWQDPIAWAVSPNPDGYFICASANAKVTLYDLKGNYERAILHCRPTLNCGDCPTIQAVYTEKDLVFDVYSLDGKEVDLKIGRYNRYKRTGEVYDVEYKGLGITRKGKASLTFSPEQNPGLEMRIDKDIEGFYESYRLPDYLEVREVDR